MATRNFVFRRSPRHGQRGGRYVLGGTTNLTSGVPVVVNGDSDDQGRAEVELATGAQDKPLPGKGGILVYENIFYDGYDMVENTFSDVDLVKPGESAQVVTGKTVKIALTNTTEDTFLNRTNYPNTRIMVAGVSQATPSVGVGDMLTPGVGDDTDGYWAETSDVDEAWLIVTSVDSTTGVVECELNF